jgi:hypothetical protein
LILLQIFSGLARLGRLGVWWFVGLCEFFLVRPRDFSPDQLLVLITRHTLIYLPTRDSNPIFQQTLTQLYFS